MTLRSRLIIAIILLLLFIFVGVFAIDVYFARQYVSKQLESHAQDAATALGLSSSMALEKNDKALMLLAVQAIFDRGYYQRIRILDMRGNVLVEREQPDLSLPVPQWFARLVHFANPTQEALVMSGWRQLGKIEVTSNPNSAYQEIWHTLTLLSFWFLIGLVMAISLALLILRIILQPLEATEKQAEEIYQLNFVTQDKIPKARELKKVVLVLNRMSQKLKDIFSEHSNLIESFRLKAFQDSVTKLPNRNYFISRIEDLSHSKEQFNHGALLLIELQNLKHYNDTHGFQKTDLLLQKFAQTLQATTKLRPDRVVARLGGAAFALISLQESHESLEQLIPMIKSEFDFHMGIVSFKPGISSEKLLAQADLALRTAQTQGSPHWFIIDEKSLLELESQGAGKWKDLLMEVIQQESITLEFQPVISCATQQILHREALLRITLENKVVNAGEFFPMAEHLNLSSQLDKLVIQRILELIKEGNHAFPYAVNLSHRSLVDSEFHDWLLETLKSVTHPEKLYFELSEHQVREHYDYAKDLAQKLKHLRFNLGIDQFGRVFSAVNYLIDLKPLYIKIDGAYTRKILNDKDCQLFIKTIVNMAHTLDIQAIAMHVENEAEQQVIKEFGLDAWQGRLSKKL